MLCGGSSYLRIEPKIEKFMDAILEDKFTLNRNIESASLLKRIAAGEKSAVEDCVNLYGNAVWNLAKKSADTVKDAENITLEIFGDIWKHAADFETSDFKEIDLIALIVRRRLNIYRQQHLPCAA